MINSEIYNLHPKIVYMSILQKNRLINKMTRFRVLDPEFDLHFYR